MPANEVENENFQLENASVEVWRWGSGMRLAIRSEQSVGKCIELSLDDACELAERIVATMKGTKRAIRDEPQA